MKLVDINTLDVINLPNDLLWEDEMKWTPSVGKVDYTLTGALIIQTAAKQAGRPITLRAPDENMAWVFRTAVEELRAWTSPADRKMKLMLEYENDTRQFNVVFRHHEGAIEADPVKGFPDVANNEWFRVKIKLMEVV